MRKISCRAAGILMLAVLFAANPWAKVQAQETIVSYQAFYDELSPYGQWVADPQYGDVWVPNEEPGYRPYATRGHWAMTDQGNMWISDVPWGWACYHYGRWTYNSYYGWVWIPGHEWAPAWVSWRSGGGCYGWAPMGPGYVVGGAYEYPENYWVFVTPAYLYQPNVYSYYEPRYAHRYYAQSNYINETYEDHGSRYYYGPRREVIERQTHRPVEVYRVNNVAYARDARESGNSVSVYRPAVNRESVRDARPANVINGSSHPVGRPQEYSGSEGQRAFRQEVQRQNNEHPHGRPEPAVHNEQPRQQQQPERQQPQPQQRQQPQEQPRPQQQQPQPQQRPTQQQFGRPQEQPQTRQQPQQQRPQEQPRQTPLEPRQQQPQPSRQQQPAQQQPRQFNQQPQQQPRQQPQFNRPQQQQQPQPQQQPRPQQQPQQQSRPQQQPQQQSRPQQQPQQQSRPQQQTRQQAKPEPERHHGR